MQHSSQLVSARIGFSIGKRLLSACMARACLRTCLPVSCRLNEDTVLLQDT
jgi:hypothetical protein